MKDNKNNEKSLQGQIVSGLGWQLTGNLLSQAFSFVVPLILARLIAPSEYGVVALMTIFLSLSQTLIDGGFGNALVQKKELTQTDICSIFYFSIVMGSVLYLLLFFTSPIIAHFYSQPILKWLLRVSSLNLVLFSILTVPNALFQRRMQFRKYTLIHLVCTIISGSISMVLAWRGLGVWALVLPSVFAQILLTILLCFHIDWHPTLNFSWRALGQMFKFGGKLLSANLINAFFTNIYGLLIGRFFKPEDLAFYNRGNSLPGMITSSLRSTIGKVFFPAWAKLQDERDKLRESLRQAIRVYCFVLFPCLTILMVCGSSVIEFLIGARWLPAVPYLWIFTAVQAFEPLMYLNMQAFIAIGASGLYLKLELIKKICLILGLFLGFRFGPIGLAIASGIVLAPISLILNTWPNKKLFQYPLTKQLKDISRTIFVCFILAIIIIPINYLNFLPIIKILIQVPVGFIVYFVLSWIFKVQALKEVLRVIKRIVEKRFPRFTRYIAA